MRKTLISANWFQEYERQNNIKGSPLTSTIRGVQSEFRSSMTRKLVELCLEARLSSVTTRPPGLLWPPLQHTYHHPWQKMHRMQSKTKNQTTEQDKVWNYHNKRNLILITGARRFELVTATCLCSETDWCLLRGFYRGGGSWGRGLRWSLGQLRWLVKIM